MYFTFIDFALRLLLALVLGASIGIERSLRKRMAGLKTNTLVAMGAAMFVMYSLNVMGEGSPTRVAAQVVSGIGFLGAGVILRDGWNVRGLTTAATIWCSAAIGVLSGSGNYLHAIFATFVIVSANILFRRIEEQFNLNKGKELITPYQYRIYVSFYPENYELVKALLVNLLESKGFQLKSLQKEVDDHARLHTIIIDTLSKNTGQEALAGIVKRLVVDRKVERIHWQEVDTRD